MTPPIYMHTTGLTAPAPTAIECSAAAGGHEVRAHVQSSDAAALADALAAAAERADDFRRTRKYLRKDTALAASGKWTTTFSAADGFRFASEGDRTALLRELARMSTQLDECDAAVAELQRDACYPLETRRCPRCHYNLEAATVSWSLTKRMILRHMAGSMHCSGTGALVPA